MPEYLREDGFPASSAPCPACACTRQWRHSQRSAWAPPQYFDGYSLSDISAYLSHESFGETIEQVVRTARPRARLCSRAFSITAVLPEHACRLEHDHAVEERLERDDHAMVHSFAAAEIPMTGISLFREKLAGSRPRPLDLAMDYATYVGMCLFFIWLWVMRGPLWLLVRPLAEPRSGQW